MRIWVKASFTSLVTYTASSCVTGNWCSCLWKRRAVAFVMACLWHFPQQGADNIKLSLIHSTSWGETDFKKINPRKNRLLDTCPKCRKKKKKKVFINVPNCRNRVYLWFALDGSYLCNYRPPSARARLGPRVLVEQQEIWVSVSSRYPQ